MNLVLPKAADIVICSYDLDTVDAAMVIAAMRTHPIVLIGRIVPALSETHGRLVLL